MKRGMKHKMKHNKNSNWEVVIGLEIHVQLSTVSKIFSGASTEFGKPPNTQACAIDLGLPGVLPVVNQAVFPRAIAFGLSIGAEIGSLSSFDRKNYFYPDLPKGYQITQLEAPIVLGGALDITLPDGPTRHIRITRAHLEEDAGKSLHENFQDKTGIDLNRAGTPLLEIVSEPDLRSPEEAIAYAKTIHQLVTFLGVSDGDMSQGSLRCDANVSVRKVGATRLGTRTETKNLNSFRFLKRAIEYEIDRQIAVLEAGDRVTQETRLYDSERDETRPMRSKETATDYRYFPEPDLLPVQCSAESIAAIKASLPELPQQKLQRFIEDYQLPPDDARVLASEIALANYFEEVADICKAPVLAANWVRVEVLARLNRDALALTQSPLSAATLGALLTRIKDETISGKIAKTIFAALWEQKATSVDDYIQAEGLSQMTAQDTLAPIIDKLIATHPKQVAEYRAGKTRVLGFFVGQVMQETQGKANPGQVNALLLEHLDEG